MGTLVSRRTLLQGGLAVGAALAVGGTVALPHPAPGRRVLSVGELALVGAIAEALFPRGAFPIDGLEAGVPERVDVLLEQMVLPLQARGFRYLLRGLDWGTLGSRGVRFVDLPVAERAEVLAAWGAPTVLPRRVASDAIKMLLGTAYFSHPDVQARIGWRSLCSGGVS